MALIAAVLVIMIVTTLSIIASQLALDGLNSSSVALSSVQTSDVAEAGIDATVTNMQTETSLPCGQQPWVALTGSNPAYFQVTISYYTSSDSPIACSNGAPSSTPALAEVASVGSTNPNGTGSTSLWHAEVSLAAQSTGGGFDKAIYGNLKVNITNGGTVYGNGTNDADIYTNNDFISTQQVYNYGNLYAQGDISSTNTEGSAGSWWAGGSICANTGTIGGNVIAAGAVTSDKCKSTGSITMGTTVVAGNATARSTISPSPCGSGKDIEGTCSSTNSGTNPGPPPSEPFPQWYLQSSQWTGYTVTNDTTGTSSPGTQCSNTAKVYTDLQSLSSAASSLYGTNGAVIYTDCQINWNWNSTSTWQFANNVAIVDIGGFGATNTIAFQSTSSTRHYFYMMVPYFTYAGPPTQTTCSSSNNGAGQVDVTNNISVGNSGSDPLAMLVYTPCSIDLTPKNQIVGQIYAGANVTITNSLTFTYQPLPVPGFSTGSGGGSGTYTVALLYKHQH